jgi:hypothetical protein
MSNAIDIGQRINRLSFASAAMAVALGHGALAADFRPHSLEFPVETSATTAPPKSTPPLAAKLGSLRGTMAAANAFAAAKPLQLEPEPAVGAASFASAAPVSDVFPVTNHSHLSLSGNIGALSLPVLGDNGRLTREPTRLEQFARKVQREGVPLARLWENQHALVSLGLSPRGKPGLWLTQKFH